jgi:hypothetical protein
MKNTFSKKLIDRYRKHMLKKYGAIISDSQAESDLDSLSTLYSSFAIAEHEQKAETPCKT